MKCVEFEWELNEMWVVIVKINIEVDYEFSNDFIKIFNEVDDKIIFFMSFFW